MPITAIQSFTIALIPFSSALDIVFFFQPGITKSLQEFIKHAFCVLMTKLFIPSHSSFKITFKAERVHSNLLLMF